jgi:N6-L-threonylcarbamoyladenine synthase
MKAQVHQEEIIILGIESSCDETAASIMHNGRVLSNVTAVQPEHGAFGGVIPELASRAHQNHIVQVVQEALHISKIQKKDISAVACTSGPGLLGALLVGLSFSKAFAWALQKPLISVNHMEAHILAHFIDAPQPSFPFLCLTVSGGHTQLVLVKEPKVFEVLSQTMDDAAGEAFDKGAKLLGLPYPGGPHVDRLAAEGDPRFHAFPVSKRQDQQYTFSGIKTSLLYYLRENETKQPGFNERHKVDIAASYQHALIQMLLYPLEQAAIRLNIRHIAIAGGVSANKGLREALTKLGEDRGWTIFLPDFAYCTDNAAMIAMAGHFAYLRGDFAPITLDPNPRMKL